MKLSPLALASKATKAAAFAALALAGLSANAFTLSANDASFTAQGTFQELSAFQASGFASIDTGTLTSFTLYSGVGTSGPVVASAFSPFPGNLFFAPTTFSAGTYTIAATGTGQFDAFFTTTPVPEPETYALFFAGLGAIGFITRRRNRS
jgi:hypothetical protein